MTEIMWKSCMWTANEEMNMEYRSSYNKHYLSGSIFTTA